MKSSHNVTHFLLPDVDRDAPFAHSWFTRPEGHATLLSMGNTKTVIAESTLEGQEQIMQDFLDLEKVGKQITRVIVVEEMTVGVIWIELFENHGVKPPSIHVMIGDPDYRGKGIGRAAMEFAIAYIRDRLAYETVYSRYLTSNTPISNLNKSLGFEKGGDPYIDDDGLIWQHVKLDL